MIFRTRDIKQLKKDYEAEKRRAFMLESDIVIMEATLDDLRDELSELEESILSKKILLTQLEPQEEKPLARHNPRPKQELSLNIFIMGENA